MGNCFSIAASNSFYSYSRSCSSSSSMSCAVSAESFADVATASNHTIANSTSIPRRILPFCTVRDLGSAYELADDLGKGQFGIIRLCKCRATGTRYACKSISKRGETDLSNILREVRLMQRLAFACSGSDEGEAQSHIVRLHQVIEDDSHVHLVMELCRGGELFHRILKKNCFSEPEAAEILKALMESIDFCHSMGVVHRDIKPENILLLDDSDISCIKLADFGLAVEISPGQKFTDLAGSAYYIAPEVLKGEYSQEIDVWSAGVVLYVMLSGVAPFNGETDEDIFNSIRKGSIRFQGSLWEKITFPAKDLISKMLCSTSENRLTPKQVLEHPWIMRHCNSVRKDVVRKLERDIKILSDGNVPEMKPQHQETYCEISYGILNGSAQKKVRQEILEVFSFKNLNNESIANFDNPSNLGPENASENDRLLTIFLAPLNEKKLAMPVRDISDPRCNEGWSCVMQSAGKKKKMVAFGFNEKKYVITCKNMQQTPVRKMIRCEKQPCIRQSSGQRWS